MSVGSGTLPLRIAAAGTSTRLPCTRDKRLITTTRRAKSGIVKNRQKNIFFEIFIKYSESMIYY